MNLNYQHRSPREEMILTSIRSQWCVALGAWAVALVCLTSAGRGATIVLTGPDAAPVSLNDQELGIFPLAGPLILKPGLYVIRCELSGYHPFVQEVRLESDEDWIKVHVRLMPFNKKTAIFSNILIAGSGQRYLGKRIRGWIFTGAEIGGLVVAINGELSYQNHYDDFKLAMDKYQQAVGEEEIAFHRKQAAEAFANAESALDLRDTGLIVAVGAIVLSVLDAWLFFPEVVAGAGPGPVGDHADPARLNDGAGVRSAGEPNLAIAHMLGFTSSGGARWGLGDLKTIHAAWCIRF